MTPKLLVREVQTENGEIIRTESESIVNKEWIARLESFAKSKKVALKTNQPKIN